MDYSTTGPNVGGNLTWIVSPTVVNEFTLGWAQWTELQTIESNVLANLQKPNLGVALGQLNPSMNPLNVIPAVSFGTAIANAATTGYDQRFPVMTCADHFAANCFRVRHRFRGLARGNFVDRCIKASGC